MSNLSPSSASLLKARRLGVGKRLGGDTAGTADPNGPKGCSTPYDIMLSHKRWGKRGGGGTFKAVAFVF